MYVELYLDIVVRLHLYIHLKLHFLVFLHFFVLNNQLYISILYFALDMFVCPGLELYALRGTVHG